jgi:hypothetical protein
MYPSRMLESISWSFDDLLFFFLRLVSSVPVPGSCSVFLGLRGEASSNVDLLGLALCPFSPFEMAKGSPSSGE